MQISGAEVQNLFEPIVSQIVGMVQAQIMQATSNGKPPKTVLLAGGFGMNEYLKKRIQAAVSSQGVEVHRMKDWYEYLDINENGRQADEHLAIRQLYKGP